MQRRVIYFILSIFLFSGCSLNNRLSELENFESFRERFYSDSAFHYSRIDFPLTMITTVHVQSLIDGVKGDSGVDTVIFTKTTLPRMIKGIDVYPENYQSKIDWTKLGVEEIISIPDSGYFERRTFLVLKNRWYLSRLYISNL